MLYGTVAASDIRPVPSVGALFSGAGNLVASAYLTGTHTISARFAGNGNLTVNAVLQNQTQQLNANFSGAGSLSADGSIWNPIQQISAAFAGAGNMTNAATLTEDAATTAWVNAVVSAGGSVSDGRKILIDDLIKGLKADGLWTKFDRLWIFAAENSQSALIDLVSDSTASLVATNPTFTADGGYTGNASGYIDTGFNATVGTNKFVRNDAHWSMWVPTSQTFNNSFTMCGTTGTTAARWMFLVGTSGHYRQINDNGIGSAYTNPPSFVGHILVSRPSSTTSKHYHDGTVFQTAAATSTGVTNANFCVLWDGAAYGKSSIQAAAFSIGSNLDSGSDAANFYNRLHTYMTAVGL